jgi:hypothetical protein
MLSRTVLVVLLSFAIWRHAVAAVPEPETLGAQWAVCAEEAMLCAEFVSSDESKAAALKTGAAVLGAYAAAASGEETAQRRREEVRSAFELQMNGQKSRGEGRRFLQSWIVEMERRSANCRQSFAEHGPRFKNEVARMIAASKKKEP